MFVGSSGILPVVWPDEWPIVHRLALGVFFLWVGWDSSWLVRLGWVGVGWV